MLSTLDTPKGVRDTTQDPFLSSFAPNLFNSVARGLLIVRRA